MDWQIRVHSFTPTSAYCLVHTCPDFRVNVYQMVRIGKLAYLAGAESPPLITAAFDAFAGCNLPACGVRAASGFVLLRSAV